MVRKDAWSFLLSGGRKKAMETAKFENILVKNEDQQSLMFAAAGRPASKGSADVLCEILYRRGLGVNCMDVFQQTPLFAAVREGNEICAEWLISKGCKVDHADWCGQTPLCVAFKHSQMDMVMKLLKHGASLKAAKDGGLAPPFFANPIFRKTFTEKQKILATEIPTSSPKKRKCVSSEAQPLWKRFRGDASLRCTGPGVMSQWAYQDEVVPEETIPPEKRTDVVAENDEYLVMVPTLEVIPRIRVLEREFVLDHADCLKDHPMHLAMAPDEWAKFSGVPVDEEKGHRLLHQALSQPHTNYQMVVAVEKKSGKVCGYLSTLLEGATLELAYFKVERRCQKQGVGTLLLEGALRLAHQRWKFTQLSLVVANRNANAIAFYRSKGFQYTGVFKRPRSAFAEWRIMKKQL